MVHFSLSVHLVPQMFVCLKRVIVKCLVPLGCRISNAGNCSTNACSAHVLGDQHHGVVGSCSYP
jgi:hypothetical protein